MSRTHVVTGAGSGIGLALARRLADGLFAFNTSSEITLRFSTGWAVAERPEAWDAALQQADAMLYREKRALR